MNTAQVQKKEGFTIIEVVLVLAIAALIMLLVFLAWPALQRGQRDQGRKADIGLVGSAIGTYKTNNKGNFPETQAKLNTAVAGVDMSQYDNLPAKILLRTTAATPPATQDGMTQMYVHRGFKCDGNTPTPASPRAGAITVRIEGNSGDIAGTQVYCQDV